MLILDYVNLKNIWVHFYNSENILDLYKCFILHIHIYVNKVCFDWRAAHMEQSSHLIGLTLQPLNNERNSAFIASADTWTV